MKWFYVVGTASIRARVVAETSEQAKEAIKQVANCSLPIITIGSAATYAALTTYAVITTHDLVVTPKGRVKEEQP